MTDIPIEDAKDIALRRRCRGVLIVAFGANPRTGEPACATVSYGHTRASCDAMKQVNVRISDLIEQGLIEIPDALQEG